MIERPSSTPLNIAPEVIGRAGWLLILGATLLSRLIVLASGTVSFHSDEAVVGLMARHINQGLPIPTFFYGQFYMGSLDALLVSVAFRLFGESVLSIRLTQSALYLLIIISGVLLARRLSGRRWIAVATGLLLAIPPVLLTLYTTMTLGGYSETLLFGNLILLSGHALTHEHADSRWRWALLGLITGLGWWTNALIAVYALPVVLYGLTQFSIRRWPGYALAGLMFLIGGAPWWFYNLTHNWEALRWLLSGSQNNNGLTFSLGERALGFVFIGLPAAMGIRYPWAQPLWAGKVSIVIVFLYVFALAYALSAAIRQATGERYLMIMVFCFTLVFVGSAFGADATGRYLLPLIVPLSILLAMWLYNAWTQRHLLGIGLLSGLLIFEGLGNIVAMRTVPPGLTSQFDPVNDFPNDDDQAVIDFLLRHDGTLGYGTYWITFRLAFLSQERVILDAWLPNKLSLIYTPVDRRYPDYTRRVEAAEHPVYVTANLPTLDTLIAQRLDQLAVRFQRQAIGPYTVFYDLSRRVTPEELMPYSVER